MKPLNQSSASSLSPLSEKGFYLREFAGRTLGLVAEGASEKDRAALGAVCQELAENDIHVVLVSADLEVCQALSSSAVLSSGEAQLAAQGWRCLQQAPCAAVHVHELPFAANVAQVLLKLGLSKVVWIDGQGGLSRDDGSRLSFVDREGLGTLKAAGDSRHKAFFEQCDVLLGRGVLSISLCTAEGLADELFTYAGSGTLFTCGGYVTVRTFGIDDCDAAHSFVLRGVEEGYLAPRDAEGIDTILSSGFGAFVEERFLAGIGSLIVDEVSQSGEIASLYTLTRFAGEGVGGHLVQHALNEAKRLGLSIVFACTTSDRVGSFFERHGFLRVGSQALPAAKWKSYPEDRRAKLLCFRRSIQS